MEVLVVGNTAYVDDDFCAKAFPGDHVQVVAADDAQRESSSHCSWKELLRHLDQAYEFDRVVTSLLISLRIPRLLATLSCCARCFVLAWAAVCSCCM